MCRNSTGVLVRSSDGRQLDPDGRGITVQDYPTLLWAVDRVRMFVCGRDRPTPTRLRTSMG